MLLHLPNHFSRVRCWNTYSPWPIAGVPPTHSMEITLGHSLTLARDATAPLSFPIRGGPRSTARTHDHTVRRLHPTLYCSGGPEKHHQRLVRLRYAPQRFHDQRPGTVCYPRGIRPARTVGTLQDAVSSISRGGAVERDSRGIEGKLGEVLGRFRGIERRESIVRVEGHACRYHTAFAVCFTCFGNSSLLGFPGLIILFPRRIKLLLQISQAASWRSRSSMSSIVLFVVERSIKDYGGLETCFRAFRSGL